MFDLSKYVFPKEIEKTKTKRKREAKDWDRKRAWNREKKPILLTENHWKRPGTGNTPECMHRPVGVHLFVRFAFRVKLFTAIIFQFCFHFFRRPSARAVNGLELSWVLLWLQDEWVGVRCSGGRVCVCVHRIAYNPYISVWRPKWRKKTQHKIK